MTNQPPEPVAEPLFVSRPLQTLRDPEIIQEVINILVSIPDDLAWFQRAQIHLSGTTGPLVPGGREVHTRRAIQYLVSRLYSMQIKMGPPKKDENG